MQQGFSGSACWWINRFQHSFSFSGVPQLLFFYMLLAGCMWFSSTMHVPFLVMHLYLLSLLDVLSPLCVLCRHLFVYCAFTSLCTVPSPLCVLCRHLSVYCAVTSLCTVPSPSVYCAVTSLCTVLSPLCVLCRHLLSGSNASLVLLPERRLLRAAAASLSRPSHCSEEAPNTEFRSNNSKNKIVSMSWLHTRPLLDFQIIP